VVGKYGKESRINRNWILKKNSGRVSSSNYKLIIKNQRHLARVRKIIGRKN
jgi:hypothetical protein